MGKRNTTIYIDDTLINLAKSKGINISQMVNTMLQSAVNLPDSDVKSSIENLEKKEAELMAELNKVKAAKIEAEKQKQKYGDLVFEVDNE